MYFSQCQEDKFLHETYFPNKIGGTYIELGALDGVLYSNTKFFQDQLGWHGILIEPHPFAYQMLEKNRPQNYLFNDLVSSIADEVKYRYFCQGHAAVSGVESTLTSMHFKEFYNHPSWKDLPQDTKMIRPRSLTNIVKSTPVQHIDFLSLDVEGHEYEVLQSWDFSVPIDIVLIEMLGQDLEKEQLCRDILYAHGYRMDRTFAHNEIFVLNSFCP